MIKVVSNILISSLLLFVYSIISNPIIAQTAVEFGQDGKPKHNIFSFRVQSWQDHFKNLKKGQYSSTQKRDHYITGIRMEQRCLSDLLLNEELTRLGYTKITKKIIGPEWRPTKK